MEIKDLVQLQSIIVEKPAVLIYFYNDNCAPCQVLRPKIASLLKNHFPLIEPVFTNAAQNTGITSHYGIFSAPTILILFDGKEVIRESKYVSIEDLKAKIERYYTLFFS
jgi:thioredoxin 1